MATQVLYEGRKKILPYKLSEPKTFILDSENSFICISEIKDKLQDPFSDFKTLNLHINCDYRKNIENIVLRDAVTVSGQISLTI